LQQRCITLGRWREVQCDGNGLGRWNWSHILRAGREHRYLALLRMRNGKNAQEQCSCERSTGNSVATAEGEIHLVQTDSSVRGSETQEPSKALSFADDVTLVPLPVMVTGCLLRSCWKHSRRKLLDLSFGGGFRIYRIRSCARHKGAGLTVVRRRGGWPWLQTTATTARAPACA